MEGATGIKGVLGSGEAWLKIAGVNEELVIKSVTDSPCRVACPAGVNVKAYVGLIAVGNFERALAVVRTTNPLPGICGRICTHPCEAECRRGEIDQPVAIRALKRFIADYAFTAPEAKLPPATPQRAEKVAVIGAGPAGLTAANDLIRLGYRVTIFEAQDKPGGMLVWGIPPFRLPRNIIEQEIDSILGLGIEIFLNTRVSDPKQLLKDGYRAVFYAPGCQKGIKLGLPREDELHGVIDSLTFLRRVYNGEISRVSGRVLVIGGGDSAIDSARVAVRSGADEVWIVYRRTREEMPAAEEEIGAAEEEGVRLDYLTQPVAFIHQEGRVVGLRCVRNTLGAPDSSGRRRPVPISGSEFVIPANWVITALGQKPEQEVKDSPEGVFVGGDAAGGPATVIDAIASGHLGARAIHRYITGQGEEARQGLGATELELGTTVLTAVPVARVQPRVLPLTARRSFEEIESVLTPSEAIQEAQRCLRCGPCVECVLCHNTCPRHLVKVYFPQTGESVFIRVPVLDKVFSGRLEKKAGVIKVAGGDEFNIELFPLIVRVDSELCRGCGSCVDVCPHSAISLKEWQRGFKVAVVDTAHCRGCGLCIAVCPSGALQGYAGPEEILPGRKR